MMTRKKPFNILISPKRESITTRMNEDMNRNPIDALVEARELHSLLLAINQRLSDQSMTYVLSNRLREDISTKDIISAISQAQELVVFNERRFEQSLIKEKETSGVS